MGKLQDFLMENDIVAGKTVEVKSASLPFPFVVKAISEGESKELRRSCTTVYTDKKTRQRIKEFDNDEFNLKLIAACCIEPNFKDAEFQKSRGVIGAENLISLVLTGGVFNDVLEAVLGVNGYDVDINDLRDEAKN